MLRGKQRCDLKKTDPGHKAATDQCHDRDDGEQRHQDDDQNERNGLHPAKVNDARLELSAHRCELSSPQQPSLQRDNDSDEQQSHAGESRRRSVLRWFELNKLVDPGRVDVEVNGRAQNLFDLEGLQHPGHL